MATFLSQRSKLTKHTVCRDEKVWQGHPDITLYKGKFYVVFRESDHHRTTKTTVIKMCYSDDGKDWTAPVVVAEGERFNCPRISVVDGSMWMVADVITGFADLVEDENRGGNELWLWRYDGDKWESPIKTNIDAIVPSKLIQVHSGHFIIAAHKYEKKLVKVNAATEKPSQEEKGDKGSFDAAYDKAQKKGRLSQYVWRVEKIGFDWGDPIAVADQQGFNFCEGCLFEYGTLLVCLMRENSRRGEPAYACFSNDSGAAWSAPMKTRLMGCHRPVAGILKSGKILTTFREQTHSTVPHCWAKNTFAALSYPSYWDQGCFMPHSVILPIDHDRNKTKPDGGYTGWAQRKNGEIVIVNYITDEDSTPFIRSYVLNEKCF